MRKGMTNSLAMSTIYNKIICTIQEFLLKRFCERWLYWVVVKTQDKRAWGQFLVQPKTLWALLSMFKFKVSNLQISSQGKSKWECSISQAQDYGEDDSNYF